MNAEISIKPRALRLVIPKNRRSSAWASAWSACVRCYETDQRTPPNEVVELMVICYNAQHT